MQTDSAFGFEKPEDSPGFMLWQTTITWQRLIKKTLEPYKISHTQHVILAILLWFDEHKYDTTQHQIVNWSKLDKMTVSIALKKLVSSGLISRTEHDVDTRAKRVQLTTKGKNLARTLVPIVEKIDADFFNKLDKQNQKFLIKILKQLNQQNELNET